MKKIILPTLLLILFLSSCISVNKSVLNTNPDGKTYLLEDVQVYFGSDDIPEHTRIAILNAKGSDTMTDESQMIDKLREEAGELGANAIVLADLEDPGAGEKFVSAFFGTSSNRKGEAVAIYIPTLDEEDEQ